MEYTTNLNLKKPDVNEYYDIEKNNENMDLIDEAVGELNSQVGTETLTTTAQNCTGAINELNKNIPKMFIDTSNILAIQTTSNWEYTATEDCIAIGEVRAKNQGSADAFFNGYKIATAYLEGSNSPSYASVFLPLKKGQTITVTGSTITDKCNITVYGLMN